MMFSMKKTDKATSNSIKMPEIPGDAQRYETTRFLIEEVDNKHFDGLE